MAPLTSLGLLTCMLTAFYKFVPNTTVRWRPALIGGTVAVALLYLNNFVAFLYVKRVLFNMSLYGSVGLLAIPGLLRRGLQRGRVPRQLPRPCGQRFVRQGRRQYL